MKAFLLTLLVSFSAMSTTLITVTENGPLISDSERVLVLDCLKSKYNATFQWDVLSFPTQKILKKDKILTLRALNNAKSLPAPKGNTGILLVKEDMYAPEVNPVFSFYIPNARIGLISTYHLNPNVNIPDWKKLRAQRIYKLITRILPMGTDAKIGGQCIMKFTNRVNELDSRAASYCPEDERSLRNSYLLKPEKSTALCELDTFIPQEAPPDKAGATTTTLAPAPVEEMPVTVITSPPLRDDSESVSPPRPPGMQEVPNPSNIPLDMRPPPPSPGAPTPPPH